MAFLTRVKWSVEELNDAVTLLFMFFFYSPDVSLASELPAFHLSVIIDITCT